MYEMTKEEFKAFMKKQKNEIEVYKWLESEKAHKDLGNDCCIEWIEKYGEKFRKDWIEKFSSNFHKEFFKEK